MILAAAVLPSCGALFVSAEHMNRNVRGRSAGSSKGKTRGSGGKHKSGSMATMKLKVTNLTYQQIFSDFFVMVHNKHATPLYTMGAPASESLAELAEDGSPQGLVDSYQKEIGDGVLSVKPAVGPVPPGSSTIIEFEVDKDFPLVTIASMAVVTNDCFVAVNGVALIPGDVDVYPGLDSGTEKNTEDCAHIPGPPCGNSGARVTEGAEGFVHIHRGFHGIGSELSAVGYDWRNPMMRVEVMDY
eukprot:CAMPEP_0113527626 /NCGR_PEP_ID=MMETSP0015_2-20120614/1396_1 /TAXON_ID=2838 /ORGANISM="Odontella" /LENGTH=242 /DNA_ID=CAMNT_0000426073 /DNA_START=181 /DNA_END=909 /DNA_ORIENTATION=- /assembly_acc=CAM_ASM_000160